MKYAQKISALTSSFDSAIIGQNILKRDILVGLFSGGHVLLEGVPGLGKTLSISVLAKLVGGQFQRIQFTPDLLPSDLIGARVFHQNTGKFSIKKGPIFSNFVLADEINRAPSKVQSALLEAMAERQVTIGDETFILQLPFMVLATQNPIEQDGTYSLPEAQLDRFFLKSLVVYPESDDEMKIMKGEMVELVQLTSVLHPADILDIQKFIAEQIFVDENIYKYIQHLVLFTREKHQKISKYIQYGASPRASIALVKAVKTYAFLQGRDYVIPEDVKCMIYPVLRHRLILSFEAIAEDINSEYVIGEILKLVEIG